MARVHKVEHARKAYPNQGIAKGDTYYWWAFRYGGKHMSKTMPRPSQLTQSEFLSSVLSNEEGLSDDTDAFLKDEDPLDKEEYLSGLSDLAEQMRDLGREQEDKVSNMESVFSGGSPTIDLLNDRASKCEEIADELDRIASEYDGDEEAERQTIADEVNSIDWSVE